MLYSTILLVSRGSMQNNERLYGPHIYWTCAGKIYTNTLLSSINARQRWNSAQANLPISVPWKTTQGGPGMVERHDGVGASFSPCELHSSCLCSLCQEISNIAFASASGNTSSSGISIEVGKTPTVRHVSSIQSSFAESGSDLKRRHSLNALMDIRRSLPSSSP
jgi:hypothetical protein